MGVFQSTFSSTPHARGRRVSVEMPWPLGPRHCGHTPAGAAGACARSSDENAAMMGRTIVMRAEANAWVAGAARNGLGVRTALQAGSRLGRFESGPYVGTGFSLSVRELFDANYSLRR